MAWPVVRTSEDASWIGKRGTGDGADSRVEALCAWGYTKRRTSLLAAHPKIRREVTRDPLNHMALWATYDEIVQRPGHQWSTLLSAR